VWRDGSYQAESDGSAISRLICFDLMGPCSGRVTVSERLEVPLDVRDQQAGQGEEGGEQWVTFGAKLPPAPTEPPPQEGEEPATEPAQGGSC
jgi:hypothetical protein